MNLREIAGGQPPNRALQLKIQQQSRQIDQLKSENKWLREQLVKVAAAGDNRSGSHRT
jgi:hypothetical protein